MKARRRAVDGKSGDGRSGRDAVDGSVEAVALGTMAAGLVMGAVEKLSPGAAAADRHRQDAGHLPPSVGQSDAAAIVGAAPAPVTPVWAADHPLNVPDATHDGTVRAAIQPDSAAGKSSHVESIDQFMAPPPSALASSAPSSLGSAPDPASNAIRDGAEVPAAHAATALGAMTPQEAIAGLAQQISSTMDALVEQMRSLPTDFEAMSSLIHHASDIGNIAGQMVNEISATTQPGIEGLSEVLGGPPADLGAATSPVSMLPASILGAATDPAGAETGAAALPLLGAAALEPLQAGPLQGDLAMPALDHAAMTATEMPPQLGFLGQSYTDVVDHHDNGSPSLTSPLHGFV
ncbi:MAG: hypothetical protein HYZ40_03205 [Rhodospirillales bacterium]|nr:hypothetical protein [Rhodospirillales bacterium]